MAVVEWRVHLASPPEAVFDALASDAGRASFGAESAVRRGDQIDWQFPGGQTWRGPVLADLRNHDRQRTWDQRYCDN